MHRFSGLGFLLLAWGGVAQPDCGEGGTIDIVGSTTAEPLSSLWAEAFTSQCPSYSINVIGGGSSEAARDVCGYSTTGAAADIGAMSREWYLLDEATTSNGWKYDCAMGDTSRSFIQVLVAYDGLTFAVRRNSTADACIASLPGSGLTIDQLRWMFSSYSEGDLSSTGWDKTSIVDSDGDDSTRLWSELGGASNLACPAEPITISGADIDSGTQFWFRKIVLQDVENGETFRPGYHDNVDDEDTMALIRSDENAIGYAGYVHALANVESVSPIAIFNTESDEFVTPSTESIFKKEYLPFTRPIYLNVFDNIDVKDRINAFMAFGLSEDGDAIVGRAGYVQTTPSEKAVMLTRLQAEGGIPKSLISCGSVPGSIRLAGSSNVFPIAKLWADVYNDFCDIDIAVEGGGSSAGARRVCSQSLEEDETPVDIGGMSRNWDIPSEGETLNGWKYECAGSLRKVTQIDIAIDGLSVVVGTEGPAYSCIRAMGGLSIEQLRWIFSDLSDSELVANGWPMETALPQSDGDETTHLWSELADTPACRRVEIKIAGQDEDSGTYQFFSETIFKTEGETFDRSRNYFAPRLKRELAEYIENNPSSIAFFGRADTIGLGNLEPVAILNPETMTFVLPELENIENGRYAPLSRRLFMNVLDSPGSLLLTRPFVNFGLSAGLQLLPFLGLSRIPEWSTTVMHTRLETSSGVPHELIVSQGCGPGGQISMAGSSTVLPVARLWASIFEIACDTTFFVEGGGSTSGAGRVCGNLNRGDPVEIGNMSREWKESEGVSTDNFLYQCRAGDTRRSVGKVPVALDGLTVAVAKGGAAEECLGILGGLTLDQLRWMFSDLSSEALDADPTWDPSSIPHSDGLDYTHLWNELHEDCEASEILIAGADQGSGTYDFFREVVFPADDESFDRARPAPYFNSESDEDLISYVLSNRAGIAYFGYSYYFERRDILSSVKIKGEEGDFIAPNAVTIADKSYPFSRFIYMNLLHDRESLDRTIPFLRFGFTAEGDNLASSTGLIALPDNEKLALLEQLDEMYETAGATGDDDSWISGSAIVGIGAAAIALVAMVALCVKYAFVANDDESTKPGGQEEPRA